MGTQWVIRSREANSEGIVTRQAYHPRHARPRRHQPVRSPFPADSPAEATGPIITPKFAVTGCPNEGFSAVSIRQVLRDRAATIVRAYSRKDGGEQWPRQQWT